MSYPNINMRTKKEDIVPVEAKTEEPANYKIDWDETGVSTSKDMKVDELDNAGNYIIEKIFQKMHEQNIDWFSAIIGTEGVGKSTLTADLYIKWCLLSKYKIDDIFTDTLIYDEDDLLKFLSTVKPERKYLPIFMDEGANILFNRDSMSKQRNYILKFFNVMRFLNSFVLICSPNIRFLDKNVRAHRLKSIFYIPERGVFWYYDKPQIERMLAIENSKKWYWVEPRFIGTYKVNDTIEKMTRVIKENYVRRLTSKVEKFIEKREAKGDL